MKNENRGKSLIFLGLLLIAAALFLTAYNLYDELRAKRSVLRAVDELEEYLPMEDTSKIPTGSIGDQETSAGDNLPAIPDYILNPNMDMPVQTINGIGYIGLLKIPSLGLELPIISQWSYPNLKAAPCRYSGSAYLNNLIICGHNYISHFGSLKHLQEGDIAAFTDMDGNVFTYKMVVREILQPTDIEEMESGDWDLTLFTCTVDGQTRLAIRFEIIGD